MRLESVARMEMEGTVYFFRPISEDVKPIKAIKYTDLELLELDGGFEGPFNVRRDSGLFADTGGSNGEQGSNSKDPQ